LVTKKRDEIFELQEKFALIGKQSSYVFHEIKKQINRLLSSSKDIDTDIHLISNILLNIELMLKNPESFKESFNHFKLNLLFLRLESEFTDYFTEYNIKFVYPTHDCDLHANEGLIYQVFKNLIVNAIEAIIANKISDESQSITINYLEKNNENKISLIFANTGSQISKLNHENIFNPFYSTKNNGKNNGLGLSFCKNIIEGHQGTIEFKPGKSGPEFLITI
jgi:signal transduction histidine kinase